MEKLMTIQQVLETVERPYTDRSGNAQVFASKGFVLTDGIDTIYAEMTGDMARANKDTQYDLTTIHAVQMQSQARPWTDSQGVAHYTTEVRIIKLS